MVGFNRVPCPPKSDTVVSVPFMKHPVKASKTLASKPTPSHGQAVLIPAEVASWTVDELKDTHYVCFTKGALEGRWYEIAGNSTTSLTIHLHGEDGVAFAPSDALRGVEFWTIDTLFPPRL